ncbi:hypothetical protein [Methylorubrum extorquens]|uniref:hypothetical protein n=1 Tax=Methylorubrum extorquens TaxID=408 RepID=UPI0002E362FA|nr:hypothetical protein [Methylorubrum extorquens]
MIAESERLAAAIKGPDCDAGDWWPDRGLVHQSVEARAAVICFPSAGVADTGAKLASLGRVQGANDIRGEVRCSIEYGNATYDDLALIVVAELLEMRGDAVALLPAPNPDPIFAAIAEGERLRRISDEAYRLPDMGLDPLPEKEVASEALYAHVNGVLLKTTPTTAAGCAALVRFAQAFRESEGISLCEGNAELVALIARSPAL